jgi:thiol-disulfide isomerase/thioredoxin
MNRLRGLLAMRAFFCCCLCLAFAACGPRTPAAPQRGDALPSLQLVDLADGGQHATVDWKGAVLVINFWATWCEPCRKEMPSLEALQQRFAGARLRVIGITMDDDLNLAREFLLAQRITFPNYAEAPAARARDALSVRLLPETILVGADGRIAARVKGARDWAGADAVAELNALLRGEPLPGN